MFTGKNFRGIFIFVLIVIFVSPVMICSAAMDYDLISGLDLNWYFENDNTTWERFGSQGYFHDYNSDGLEDYLFFQRDTGNQSRLFCIDTSNSPDPKTYADDKTAWRVFDWVEGTFIPRALYFKKKHGETRTPDLVLRGRDKTDDYTKIMFRRLNETNDKFPTEKSWEHSVNSDYVPTVRWSESDFNGDDYPDYIIYNYKHDDAGKFFIGCYNGLDGSEIWSVELDKAADDQGVSIPGYTSSNIQVMVAGSSGEGYANGDFDGNGKPEVVVYYTFMFMDIEDPMAGYFSRGLVQVLKSDGSFYYSGGDWWTVYDYNIMIPLAGSTSWDYNGDDYVDFHLLNTGVGSDFSIPVLQTFDLKNKTGLFSTTNSDFGDVLEDVTMYYPMPVLSPGDHPYSDFDGDGYMDIVFTRMTPMMEQDVSFGVFHGYAGGGADAGRKIWLTDQPDYNYCLYGVNDWNGDGFLDHFLASIPGEPGASNIQWDIKLPYLGEADAGEHKTFSYAFPYEHGWNASEDSFSAQTISAGLMGDVDGDGQKDTECSLAAYIDNGDDNTTDFALNRVHVFDNTPSDQDPDITAEMEVTVTGEDINIASAVLTAYDNYKEQYIDQNGDGSPNDIVVTNQRVVFALSFQYAPEPPTETEDVILHILGMKPVPSGEEDQYDINGDGIYDVADIIELMKS